MKDEEFRRIVLQDFYNQRGEAIAEIKLSDFGNKFTYNDLQRICRQLQEQGLIGMWHPMMTGGGDLIGAGQIAAAGTEVVEGTPKPSGDIVFNHSDHSSNISINASPNAQAQAGNGNTQNTFIHVDALVARIDASNASQAEKAEAKSLLKQFLAHPIVAAIVGALASTL